MSEAAGSERLRHTHRLARGINRLLPWGWRLTHPDLVESGSPVRSAGAAAAAETSRSERSLFILGHARSGTTILQNALNDVRCVFLFGEADLHWDPGTPDFRARYNDRQRGFGNQENKSSLCPKLFEGDAGWEDYFAALLMHYRYVGAKIVINPDGAGAAAERFFDFATRHFYRAHYLFTFRNPVDVVCSTRGLAIFQGLDPAPVPMILSSFLAVMRLHILMLRNLPNVHVVFHEAMSPEIFAALGRRLELDLGGVWRYYNDRKVRSYSVDDVPGACADVLERVTTLYGEYRRQALAGFDLIQIEQNSGSVDPTHPTALGRLYSEIEALIGALGTPVARTREVPA